MSISSDLTRIKNAKSAIITSITNKGVAVPSGTKIDGLAPLINKISTGATRQTPASLGYAQSPYLFFFDGQYPFGGYAKPSDTTPIGGVIDMQNGIVMSASELIKTGANYFSTVGNTTSKLRKYDVGYGYQCYPLLTQFTFEITFMFNSLPNYSVLWGFYTTNSTKTGLTLEYGSSSGLVFKAYNLSGTQSSNTIVAASSIKANNKYCVQIRRTSSGNNFYLNGSNVKNVKTIPINASNTNKALMSIAGAPAVSTAASSAADNGALDIKIYAVRLHTNLTDASLTQNYNRDKARFGIT